MNKKILATFMALGMVLMSFSMLVVAETPVVTPSLAITMQPIGGVAAPVVTDNQGVAFAVAGWCDVAVEAEVEISTTADFVAGTGTNFATADDNYATGAYRVLCSGLVNDQIYNYRVKLTNGADKIKTAAT